MSNSTTHDASLMRLILASGSPQRRRLLRNAGYKFDIIIPRPEAEPGICSQCGPAELVTELAVSKAFDVAAQMREMKEPLPSSPHVILACDTVAECGGEILGKPRNEDHARQMLQRLRGSVHRVYSGVCAIRLESLDAPLESMAPDIRLAITELVMDQISDAELDDYLASGLWLGKAGAFGYQDRVGWLHITRGSESNVVGLPMEVTAELLSSVGVSSQGLL